MANYIDTIAGLVGDRCGIADRDEDTMRLLRIYAVLVLTLGESVTDEHVHDAWSAWRADTQPAHRSLIPFASLAPDVQALDAPYAAAIREVAQALEELHDVLERAV